MPMRYSLADRFRIWLHRQVARGARLARERAQDIALEQCDRDYARLKVLAAYQGWDLDVLNRREVQE